MGLAAVSVDLDEIPCYCAIHGLPIPADARATAIYDHALPRLLAWFARRHLRATLFVVGRDLERDEVRAAVRAAHQAGHEIASHSYSHRYDLSRLGEDAITDDLRRAHAAIEAATGVAPVGFRAPGYTLSEPMRRAVGTLGYRYDSSLFPCPPYYLAKASAMAWKRIRGAPSRAVLDAPRVLLGNPELHEDPLGFTEIPMALTPTWAGRLPVIGTSVVLAGPRGARWLARSLRTRRVVNLELHGIDASDCEADGLRFLHGLQPDLRVALDAKFAALDAVVDQLERDGRRFVTLAELSASTRAL